MTSLFILQLVCCVITAMLALQLAMASLQVRWKVWRYEISRWLLVASMLFFSVHYLLQMVHGLRAQGTDVGAAFNILFYTPVAFAITLSIINIESTGSKVRRHCLRSMMAYILIALVFVIGIFQNRSLHIGNMLYVMLGLFVASMAYFIFVIRKETYSYRIELINGGNADFTFKSLVIKEVSEEEFDAEQERIERLKEDSNESKKKRRKNKKSK
mgnify:CR=1 FL=1